MHPGLTALTTIAAATTAGWILHASASKQRRLKLMHAPFPAEWTAILENNIPPYKYLSDALRSKLHGYINVFLAEKNIEGCGGQEIDDNIRVTIAGQACMLLIGRDSKCYPGLKTILVYPSTYVAGGKGTFGSQHEPASTRLGESWQNGMVVLSWDSVLGGARNFHDGHNVTFHEFAHQLDQEDGDADGAPILDKLTAYGSWARVLGGEFRKLRKKGRKRRSVIDSYGATNPAEFFAVATESFFEKPYQLQKKAPDLYDELKSYYHLDPLNWKT